MKRRNFLRNTLALSSGPLWLNQLPIKAFATESMLPLLDCQGVNDRILVLLFFKGGNDGINTIFPSDQYDSYIGHRPQIALANSGNNPFIPLDSTLSLQDQVGIHPVMGNFKAMYEAGNASIIQAVGYPNSNGSHFKSTDLWLTGGDGTDENFNIGSGWMGRFLDSTYPGLYGKPTAEFADPLGIQLGDRKPSFGYYSQDGLFIASNLAKSDDLYGLVQSAGTPAHTGLTDTDYDSKISYIMSMENSTNIYADRIGTVLNSGINSSVTYPDTDLGAQFKTVAKLISGGCKTKIYMLHIGGFDTHGSQVESGSPHLGKHAGLLANVFDSIDIFYKDLTNMGMNNRVLTSTFSEFGRKVIQNGSLGTDHGNYGPMFLFGPAIEAGIKGTNVDLSDVDNNGKLNEGQIQFDYRQVFKTLIQDWLGGSDAAVQTAKFDSYSKVPNLLKTTSVADPTCYSDTYITQIVIRAKFLLEGFYNVQREEMSTELKAQGILPAQQPYNTFPYNYTGTENVLNFPFDTSDWVLVELRDANDINTVITRQAALVNRNGELMDLDGSTGVLFRNVSAGSYYIAVYHRNHIAVVSSVPYNSSSSIPYDFTASADAAMGTEQLKMMGDKFALFAGDFSVNGTNDDTDYNSWKDNAAGVNTYDDRDGDGNGVVNVLDFNLWKQNKNKTGINIIQQ